ncbi:hypothetical protein SMM_0839 [Spiroplasma mirum ATCC 29335]|nr:hypothetical protein SMM_0839 [Spiroplasma mirum ATCC 29335]
MLNKRNFTEVNNFILTYQEQFKIAEISKEITNQFKFYQNNLVQLNYESSIIYDENLPIYLSLSVFNYSEESIW